jgi:hypothetical protein
VIARGWQGEQWTRFWCIIERSGQQKFWYYLVDGRDLEL